ncbi:hypothetical protein SAMN05444340_11012 [Citreimonas salinaria]|uniref:Uncharacterized protein n=1 Tax=Citreimonas salinaria TaxID=321339 RepID=A0A1H3KNG8_9RHOB|nr:hypothetical protein SAMN05444340_11012 [Citreimonas salinaria]
MFFRANQFQYNAKPEKPDPSLAPVSPDTQAVAV